MNNYPRHRLVRFTQGSLVLLVLLGGLCASCATQPAATHPPTATATATVVPSPTPVTLKGRITEFTTTGYPDYLVAGPDHAMWFTDNGAIGRITLDGHITYPARPSSQAGVYALSITPGPDNAMWYTALVASSGDGAIGRYSLAGGAGATGASTNGVFPIHPGTDTRLSVIITGPDGALWFLENGAGTGGKIGRITTAGTLTEYPSRLLLRGLTTGPDGAIWFTEGFSGAGSIGRITTDGHMTTYPLPSTAYAPLRIVSGPDGALWFTEIGNPLLSSVPDKIGRITTTGEITEFALPKGHKSPTGITKGPDGALWFTEAGAESPDPRQHSHAPSWIGRITTQGEITEYPLPHGGSSPYTIAASASALWFSEYSGQRIGELT